MSTEINKNTAKYEFLMRLGDDRLILSQRLSEWCGHGPILEEDIATANIALDLLGQAKTYFEKAAELDPKNRSADDLVFHRMERDYRSIKMVELDNGDFAQTMARQFFFDTFELLLYRELLNSKDDDLKGFAEKFIKETKYHLRHTSEWLRKFGGGTEESHRRLTNAVDTLWEYTGEMFYRDEYDEFLIDKGITPDISKFKDEYYKNVNNLLTEADIEKQDPEAWMQSGGRKGMHTEHLGHILAEMQYLPRAMPKAEW